MNDCESNILEQYRYMVDETNVVSKSDLLGTITFANNKFLEASGYALDELLGKPHSILRDPLTPSSVYKELWDTIQSKKVWKGVITNIKKDGTQYIVEASIYPIISKDGNILEYISIRHDITKLRELNHKINRLREYDISQQHIAKEKLEAGIVNQLDPKDCKVVHYASDVVSGDFYSIFKRKDGSTFAYLIDGQGHGVSPGLTVFAISATIKHLIDSKVSLKKFCETLFPIIKTFLGDIEQLSYVMIMISPKGKKLSYVSGGMYPFLIKKEDEISIVKANNLPFMEFSDTPKVSTLEITNWESLMIYSDGVVEHNHKNREYFLPENLIRNPDLIDRASEVLPQFEFDDDVTLIHLFNALSR